MKTFNEYLKFNYPDLNLQDESWKNLAAGAMIGGGLLANTFLGSGKSNKVVAPTQTQIQQDLGQNSDYQRYYQEYLKKYSSLGASKAHELATNAASLKLKTDALKQNSMDHGTFNQGELDLSSDPEWGRYYKLYLKRYSDLKDISVEKASELAKNSANQKIRSLRAAKYPEF